MQNPWDNDPIIDAQPIGARPIYRQGPPRPSPRHPDDAYESQVNASVAGATREDRIREQRAKARAAEADAKHKERILNTPQLSEGWKAIDKEFATNHYVPYTAGGGFADISKQMSQLREVSQTLKSGANVTGPIVGRAPDFITSFTNPRAIATREAVEEPVQRSLRAILGAQFTEKEGERLIARAYNPTLPEVENRKRVARLRIQLNQAARAKESAVRYFEKHGTLKGWKGRLWSAHDFNPDNGKNEAPPEKPGLPDGWSIEED